MAHPIRDHTELLTVIDRLLKLNDEKSSTLQQLRRLVLIADLLCMPIGKIEGRVSTYVDETTPRSFFRWMGAEFVIRHDNVDHRFPLVQIPLELWPAHLRVEYESHLKSKRRDRAGAKPDQY